MIDLFKRETTDRELISGGSICVWGPTGSPGKSTFALNLACELALNGRRVLLIDFDTYSSSVGTLLGINQPPPGLAAAARLAGQGRLDGEQFSRLAIQHQVGKGTLSVLIGLGSDLRWPEITAEKTKAIIESAHQNFDYAIIDVASPIESGIKQVGGVVERNAATRTALEICTTAIAIFNADQVGVKRFCDTYERLCDLARNPILVANRLRNSALGVGAQRQIEDAIQDLCGCEVKWFIPEDRASCDGAVLGMVPLAMLKRSSGARQAIAQFARSNFAIGEGRKSTRPSKLS
jgi:MinD-like ATPase involved in chromosome partitioning or flagellar assembly